MTFLRNAWYVAGWSDTIQSEPTQIRVLGELVALFRTRDAQLHAIGGRCPHRFASLGCGKIVGDTLECPYHGLRFDHSGQCVFNPHVGGGTVPAAKVTAYPLVERYRAVWIWMGDPEKADDNLIPDFSCFDDPSLVVTQDYLNVGANYELVSDNLLDLSHVAFIHPFLTNPGFAERSNHIVKQDGNTIWSISKNEYEKPTPVMQLLWDSDDEGGAFHSNMRWSMPANLLLDVRMVYCSEKRPGPLIPTAHLLTPESEHRTHYFWMLGRNKEQDDQKLTELLHDGVKQAFETEDEPMIAQISDNMNGEDFWNLRPVILPSDGAAIRARRLLAQQIRREAVASARVTAP